MTTTPQTLYRERGGLDNLIILSTPAITPGMVTVARVGEDYEAHPELVWQVWPADLEPMSKNK